MIFYAPIVHRTAVTTASVLLICFAPTAAGAGDKSVAGRFSNGLYSTCPENRDIKGLSDMYTSVDERDLLKLAKSRPVVVCPDAHCDGAAVPVDITVNKDGTVGCGNAKSGRPELQKAAVDAAMQMRFKRFDSGAFGGFTGVMTFTFSEKQ